MFFFAKTLIECMPCMHGGSLQVSSEKENAGMCIIDTTESNFAHVVVVQN